MPNPDPSPIIILGLHRSGTTILYEMLADSGAFDILTAWHVICFEELRNGHPDKEQSRRDLEARFQELGLTTRGLDAIKASLDTPEEYGFLLDNCGRGHALSRHNLPVFRGACRVVADGRPVPRPPLFKNTWDFSHGGRIASLVPDARFIYIHRHPHHVLSSVYRAAVAILKEPNPYIELLSKRYARFSRSRVLRPLVRGLSNQFPWLPARILIRLVGRQTRAYLRTRHMIPPDRRIEIRYEDLCERPNETMNAIFEFLRIEAAPRDWSTMIHPRNAPVAPEITAQAKLMRRKLSAYAGAFGYDL
jgi:hypothetical protein